MKKINVLHLLSWFPRPDQPMSGNFCLKHIRSVSDDVNSVVLSAYIDPDVSQREIEVVNYANFQQVLIHVPASPLPSSIPLFLAYNAGFTYIRKHFFQPDLMHLHVALPLGKMAFYWKKRHRLPYLLTEHWTIYQPQNVAMMTRKTLRSIRKIANGAELILPVSHDLADNMRRYGIDRPFRCIPNVVDTQIFHPDDRQPHEIKHILHISTLRDEAKNFSGILRTVQRLSQQRQDFVLDVVHEFDRPEFERFAIENHLEKFVVFHGRKEERDIAEFYQRADFLLLFSNFENLPCVIIEAFACGLPIITTEVGGISEIMDESRGLTVPARDEDALLQALHQMLDHCHDYDEQAICAYAEANFSMPVIGQQLREAYETVLRR